MKYLLEVTTDSPDSVNTALELRVLKKHLKECEGEARLHNGERIQIRVVEVWQQGWAKP